MPHYRFPISSVASMAATDKTAAAAPYLSVLETQFPRILQAIQALWGYPELNHYFDKLMINDRGDREGFPPEAWDEIFLLMHMHRRIVPPPL